MRISWVRCVATGKRSYQSRADAKRIAKRDGLRSDPMRPYSCDACGGFHLGHLREYTRAEHREYHSRELVAA